MCFEENNQNKFRGQSFALPGGTIKQVYLDLASLHFEFDMRRYTCTIAVGRIAEIQIAR